MSGVVDRGVVDVGRRLRFERLVREWEERTTFLSSVTEVLADPALREIVGMGWPAVPWILGELERSPSLLVAALGMITGADPVADDDRGDVERMAALYRLD